MNEKLIAFLILLLSAVFMAGGYWIAKHGSYWLWYEDMVIQTIQEQVNPEYLKHEIPEN